MDELLTEFIAETRETLDALTGEVIAWEADPSDRARLDSVFRFVHTVKGSCGFLDLPRFAVLSHAAEDVLAELRGGTRLPDSATVSAVLAVIDRIGELTEALAAGETAAGDDGMLIAALRNEAAPVLPIAPGQPLASAAAPRAPARSIRIPLDLLDRMMGGISDMVLARNELARRLRDIDEPGMEGAFERLSTCVAEMRDSITRTRMQRIEKLFAALPRMVRDLSAEMGKAVELELDGGDVELDREMIELMRDPLTHIVRNSLDHGLEAAAERIAAGKPASGHLTISARQSGNQIVIEIADDGRGINLGKITERAVASGLIRAEQAERMTPEERCDLIFHPGLSTADRVSAVSGRGVGMDVVRANIERIGGQIEVQNRPGMGLRLVIRVPLTLTIIAALTVTAGEQGFAIPRSAIEEICHDGGEAIRIDSAGGAGIATIRGRALPLIDLETVLGMGEPSRGRGRTLVVLRAGSNCTFVLGVAAVHDHEELVIKPASPPIMSARVYAGKSLPDSGVPMLLLDVSAIAQAAGIAADAEAFARVADTAEPLEERVPTLLFEDLDGRRRALRLSLIERIEDVPAADISRTGGRLRIAVDGRLLPLLGTAAAPAGDMVKIVRVGDGHVELAYAIADVIDIVSTPAVPDARSDEPGCAGVVLIDGEQVELLDGHHLLASVALGGARPAAPLCLLGPREDGWARDILRPLIEAAGYRTAFAGEVEPGEADVIVLNRVDDEDDPAWTAPVVRLVPDMPRPGSAAGGIYRYDRVALLDALARSVGGR